ncbi:hypothetical protein Sjap_003900 [Stephania japonica]|uniref:Late embryogenesis abundant protein LEA-2 subgroup domain-containing protein n=1 Tax=Stephania japonica TaxID=461633 RepID=A0AAP0KSA9_9MAGN
MLPLPPPPSHLKQFNNSHSTQTSSSKQQQTMIQPSKSHKQSKSSSSSSSTPCTQIVLSKQPMIQKPHRESSDDTFNPKLRKASSSSATLLRPPRPTNPLIWCTAVLCVIFSVLLIVAGIATLVIFLSVKPKRPLFDTTVASLNSIYLDSTEYFNGDFIFLANFTNPNRKIDVRFEYLDIELYFFDRLIANQVLEPFTERRGEARLQSVHLISSEVYLPLNLSLELRKQIQSNRVKYNIRGTFRVRASIGLIHFSYWLYGRCQIEMTGPPSGVLISRSCRTKR